MSIVVFILSFYTISTHAAQISLKELGDQEFKKNNFSAACGIYSQALLQDPTNSSLYMNRGLASFKHEDYDQAIADFNHSLKLNKTAKAYHWLGRSYLQKMDLSRAYYFLSQAAGCLEPAKDNHAYFEMAQRMFQDRLDELEPIKKHYEIGNFLHNYKKVRGYNYQFLANKFYMDEYGQFVNCLGSHWDSKGYNPVAVMENPGAITEFMGTGKHVATVIVQTIPLHLSMRFERVSVFDTSKAQIDFHNRLVDSIKHNSIAEFIGKSQKELNVFLAHEKTTLDPKITSRIPYEFKKTYQFADNHHLKDTIKVFHQDIFDGVDAEPTIDVVFLSSIPFLKLSDWQKKYYPKLRRWLGMKKTVIFSILGSGLYVDAIFHELTERFDDIALMDNIVFEQTPTTIHVKLTPKGL